MEGGNRFAVSNHNVTGRFRFHNVRKVVYTSRFWTLISSAWNHFTTAGTSPSGTTFTEKELHQTEKKRWEMQPDREKTVADLHRKLHCVFELNLHA